jgi:hypothetical protein
MNETGSKSKQRPYSNSTHQAPHNVKTPYQHQVTEGKYGGNYSHLSVLQIYYF